MRIAIVSDIHGNRTAFEAVLADLRQTSPDLILHGGDLADSGSSPAEIVDRVRDLGWQGGVGNTGCFCRWKNLPSNRRRNPFSVRSKYGAATQQALGEGGSLATAARQSGP